VAKTYEPEQEEGYVVNRWCWYRSNSDDPHSVPTNLFRLLASGTDHINYRSYATKDEARADLQQALGQAAV
jgi:hypothetical protein